MTCTVAVPTAQINLAIAIAKKYRVLVEILYEDDMYSHIELIGTKKNIEKTLDSLYMI